MIRFVDDEEAEAADFVVCAPLTNPPCFADNIVGTCCKCGCTIQLRPSAPKRPKKICIECAPAVVRWQH